jgi:hypothetical protein
VLAPHSTSTPTASTDDADLADLAHRISDEYREFQQAFANALAHALAAGDALIEARDRVAIGWKHWLRENCALGASTARLFMQLAHHRERIEAEIERVPELSLRAARGLIAKPKAEPSSTRKRAAASAPAPAPAPTDTAAARIEQWRERRLAELNKTLTKALRTALSLQQSGKSPTNALNGILAKLHAGELDLHDVHIVIAARRAHTRRRSA